MGRLIIIQGYLSPLAGFPNGPSSIPDRKNLYSSNILAKLQKLFKQYKIGSQNVVTLKNLDAHTKRTHPDQPKKYTSATSFDIRSFALPIPYGRTDEKFEIVM